MSKRRLFSKQDLQEAVNKSKCMADVLRNLGVAYVGSTHGRYTDQIKRYGIDISHFADGRGGGPLIERVNGGKFKKLTPEEIFAWSKPYRAGAKLLRYALLSSGVEHKCVICQMTPIWNGKYLQLEVDHIDGDWLNNKKENLRFLCPNCHSQV